MTLSAINIAPLRDNIVNILVGQHSLLEWSNEATRLVTCPLSSYAVRAILGRTSDLGHGPSFLIRGYEATVTPLTDHKAILIQATRQQ